MKYRLSRSLRLLLKSALPPQNGQRSIGLIIRFNLSGLLLPVLSAIKCIIVRVLGHPDPPPLLKAIIATDQATILLIWVIRTEYLSADMTGQRSQFNPPDLVSVFSIRSRSSTVSSTELKPELSNELRPAGR